MKENEKIFYGILSSDFDDEVDFYTADCEIQTIQEKILGEYRKLSDYEKPIVLQAGYRVLLQMMENCRHFLQFQLNLRFGKCYYLIDRLDLEKVLEELLDKKAFDRMDLSTVTDLDPLKRLCFFKISSVMLQFRSFFIKLVEDIFNKEITEKMAENFVEKCTMVPQFELVDGKGVVHATFEDFLKAQDILKEKKLKTTTIELPRQPKKKETDQVLQTD